MKRLTWLAVLTLIACSAPPMPMNDAGTTMPGETVPVFLVVDVNPASATANQQVGPKTWEGKVTGWYFGHSS